ncbi:MAG: DNA replication/repair protein RecF [Bacteroidia bacterium]|jgi:DNA replication and repair protein RecF|nr:DNA replication/repair protein RecF [Bacteroidia bacterium]
MYLKQLSLVNFKNYTDFEASFSKKVNCFVGNNGVGKTNLLDAIHYLSFCKSFFNPVDSQNIRHNEGFFMLQGWFEKEGETNELHCALKRHQKKVFKKNKREYERLSEHLGQFPLVMISPSDTELIHGSSEQRRKFIDSIISQYDKAYLDNLIAYNHVLKQRNALLKQFQEQRSFDAETLDIMDEQLVIHGQVILEKRIDFLKTFIPLFNRYYQYISGSGENVSLQYENSLGERDFKPALMAVLSRDRALNYTSIGPHKDDMDFQLEAYPLKRFASQGQQKSYLLALKLAQFEFIKNQKNIKPLLLLDDVYDKLDEQRFTKLLELVSGDQFGQVFITDTHPERMEQLLSARSIENRIFVVGETTSAGLVPEDSPEF